MSDSTTPTRHHSGRELAGATLLMLGLISMGALFADASDDPRGAGVFGTIPLLPFLAAVPTRAASRRPATWLVTRDLAQPMLVRSGDAGAGAHS